MQKGHVFRRAQNRYAMPNWVLEDGWPAYLSLTLAFEYGIGTQTIAFQKSSIYQHRGSPMAFVWNWAFSIEVIDFTCRLGIVPVFTTPQNYAELQIVDPFGSSVTATWIFEPGKGNANGVTQSADGTMVSITATGSFRPIEPIWDVFALHYNEEP
jgi:hypothetical protein